MYIRYIITEGQLFIFVLRLAILLKLNAFLVRVRFPESVKRVSLGTATNRRDPNSVSEFEWRDAQEFDFNVETRIRSSPFWVSG